ncbi:MAG: VWA domain-containing protein [Alphaproteobacteria bacterium]|nr:VWA domain-containing protein [Alphaproteobacteria bacterium]
MPAWKKQIGSAIYFPMFDKIKSLQNQNTVSRTSYLRLIISVLVWILCVCAAARPQYAGNPIKTTNEGRNLMLVLDLSGSMGEMDFVLQNKPVRRWDAVRSVAKNFVDKRTSDRVGVVLFGERAYLYAPLSYDLKTLKILLNEADVGMAGSQTAIGDALGIAIKNIADVPAETSVIILLSDGISNAGILQPLKAAELANRSKIKIYTIGAGSDIKEMNGLFGNIVISRENEIDEATLKKVAEQTGGKYFRAKNTTELIEIYDEIDKLETAKNDDIFIRPTKELFYIPLGIAFGLVIVTILCFYVIKYKGEE